MKKGKYELSPSIRGIIFDLDNTLVGIRGMGNYIRTLTRDILFNEFSIGNVSDEELFQLFKSGKGHREILSRWGILNPDEFWGLVNSYDLEYREKLYRAGDIFLYDDVKPVLESLYEMNIPMGILSNTTARVIKWSLEKFDLSEYFSFVIGLGENQDDCKPEPRGLFRAMELWGIENRDLFKDVLFVGDSPIDIEAALRAGVTPIWIFRKENYGDHSEKYMHNLHEKILTLIKKYKKGRSPEEALIIIRDLREILAFI